VVTPSTASLRRESVNAAHRVPASGFLPPSPAPLGRTGLLDCAAGRVDGDRTRHSRAPRILSWLPCQAQVTEHSGDLAVSGRGCIIPAGLAHAVGKAHLRAARKKNHPERFPRKTVVLVIGQVSARYAASLKVRRFSPEQVEYESIAISKPMKNQ